MKQSNVTTKDVLQGLGSENSKEIYLLLCDVVEYENNISLSAVFDKLENAQNAMYENVLSDASVTLENKGLSVRRIKEDIKKSEEGECFIQDEKSGDWISATAYDAASYIVDGTCVNYRIINLVDWLNRQKYLSESA